MNQGKDYDPSRLSLGRAGQNKHVGHSDHQGVLSTEQMRIVGQRRRDAEEKLQLHQEQARLKVENENGPAEPVAGV
jgi:hypothetical protein